MNFKNWDEYKLGDICTKIGSGATPSGGGNAYKNIGISLIRSQNVRDFSFSNEGLAFIDDGQADKLKGVTVKAGDVLLNITGDSVARSCIVTDEVLPARVNQHVSIIRVNEKVAHNKFVFYFTQFIKPQLLSLAGNGATRNALTKAMIEQLDIFLPPLPEQRAIAATLSALDDKIELNNRINKTLEEMAQTLFKQWFVDFEFPDENGQPYKSSGGEMEESKLGLIPKGWKKRKLDEFFPVITGKKDANCAGTEGIYPFFSCSQIQNLFTDSFSFEGPAILLAGNGDFNVKWCRGKFEAYQRTYVLKPYRIELLGIFFFVIQHFLSALTAGFKGSVIRFITKGMITNYEVVLPADSELIRIGTIFNAIIVKIDGLKEETKTLSSLRDALLPKLMSGEIRVPIEEVAADV